MTQWPNNPNTPTDPGTPAFTTPGTGSATTPFSNVTMETFDQKVINKGCMACHDTVGPTSTVPDVVPTDFIWALEMNASPASTGTNASQPQFHVLTGAPSDPALKILRMILDAPDTPAKPKTEVPKKKKSE
jgi:hypothetical protein